VSQLIRISGILLQFRNFIETVRTLRQGDQSVCIVVTILCLITARSRVLLEKLTGSQLVKKYPAFYETRRFITSLQVPANCPYPEPDRSNPFPYIVLSEDLS